MSQCASSLHQLPVWATAYGHTAQQRYARQYPERICINDVDNIASVCRQYLTSGRYLGVQARGRGSTQLLAEDTISRWRKVRLGSAQSLSRPQLDEHPPLYCISLSPTLVLHCILLLSSFGIAYASRPSVVALFHLSRLPYHKQSTPTGAAMHLATMHSHANGSSWLRLR